MCVREREIKRGACIEEYGALVYFSLYSLETCKCVKLFVSLGMRDLKSVTQYFITCG